MQKNLLPAKHPVVLLVEHDDLAAEDLVSELTRHGFVVERESNGDRAVDHILREPPEAVLLELRLPGKDAFAVCREVRHHYGGQILMLTRQADDLDHILALELGADDFIIKPSGSWVVAGRLKAALRRADRIAELERGCSSYRVGELCIDRDSRTVRQGNRELVLTTAEFDLLWLLMSRAGEIMSRAEIMHSLRRSGTTPTARSIDVRVGRLRRLIGDDDNPPRRIKTVRGKGYLLARSE